MLKAAYRFFNNDGIAPPRHLAPSCRSDIHPHWALSLWSWPCKIPQKSTGRGTRPPKGWGLWAYSLPRAVGPYDVSDHARARAFGALGANRFGPRDPADVGNGRDASSSPISQKESQKWLHSLDAVYTAHDCCPTTGWCASGTGKPMSMTCWPLRARRGSIC